jgi:hypothetical protein
MKAVRYRLCDHVNAIYKYADPVGMELLREQHRIERQYIDH